MDEIRPVTFRALLEHKHELICWCPGCRRWAKTDLAMLVKEGLGNCSIMRCKARCRKCYDLGEWQTAGRYLS